MYKGGKKEIGPGYITYYVRYASLRNKGVAGEFANARKSEGINT